MKTLTSLVALSLLAASANAAITGNGGMTTLIGAPLNAQQFNLVSPNVSCWNEQSGVTSSATVVNLTAPGTYFGTAPNLGIISGTFDSHFLHFDPGAAPAGAGGSVQFSTAIRGIIYDATLLSNTDATFGSGGTLYDTANPLRSLLGNALGGNVLTFAGNNLNFQIGTGNPGQINRMIEIRVLTDAVPTPGTGTIALAGTLLAARRRR
jgi:hypothetical protein